MKIKNILLLAAFLIITNQGLTQQIFINLENQVASGHPVVNPILSPFGVQWGQSVTSLSGDLITVGHTHVPGQGEDLYLVKRDPGGNLIFETSFNSNGSNDDYGINLFETSNGEIYVCGTADNGVNTGYDLILLHYDAAGTLINSTVWDSGNNLNDIGTGLLLHPVNGNLYVAASSEGAIGNYNYLLLEVSPANLQVQSSNSYDYAALMDVTLGIEVDLSSGDVILIGGSQNSSGSWSYALASYDVNTLAFISDSRTSFGGLIDDHPVAFKKDSQNNIFITGKTWNGTDYNIKTVKVLPNYSIAWTSTIDVHGSDDLPSSIDADAAGDVIVGGFSTANNGQKNMYCALLNGNTGAIVWQWEREAALNGGDALIRKLQVKNGGKNIYFVGGEDGSSGKKEVVTGRIAGNGVINWHRNIISQNDIVPSDLEIGNDLIYVVSVIDSVTDSYQWTTYSEFEADTSRNFNNGVATSKASELIVGLNPAVINKNVIDNLNGSKVYEYCSLQDFITDSAYQLVSTALEGLCRGCTLTVSKIYKGMKTTDTVTVSRRGVNVPIPAFWATALLHLPASMGLAQTQQALGKVPGIVFFSHPNYFPLPLTSPPNDSLYPSQLNLHSVNSTSCDINAEEAWDLLPSAGLPFVRAGVFDSGVHWRHEEWGYNGSNAATSKVNGWYFYSDGSHTNIKYLPTPDSSGHGTTVMGVMGANRNNKKGISGIAGGDSTNSPGISMFALKILGGIPLSIVLDIMHQNTLAYPQFEYGCYIDFANHSWGLDINKSTAQGVQALQNEVRFGFRNQLTFVTARGNAGINDISPPATFDSTWVLSVGGTNSVGQYKQSSDSDAGWAPSYGGGIDVAAPCVPNIVKTFGANPANGGYVGVNGTSIAAPHVAGVVGLLMSYHNASVNAHNNLSPEDCEFIITRSATDVGAPGYDSLTGYGRLNAGKALRMIEKPVRILYHFGANTLTPHIITTNLFQGGDTIVLTEPYETPVSPKLYYPPARYVVNAFEVTIQTSHNNTHNTDSVMFYWPRPSESFLYDKPKGPFKTLNLHEHVEITSCNLSGATLKGYVYQVKDTTGTDLGWWPCDTSFAALFGFNRPNTLAAYTLLAKNKAVGIADIEMANNNLKLYPNPSGGVHTLEITATSNEEVKVYLYDINGRKIETVYEGKLRQGKNLLSHDLSKQPNSVYIYVIEQKSGNSSFKVIKSN